MLNSPCAASVQNCGKEADMNTQKLNILYGRLSRDDELQGPSNSILNQQQLLEEYANTHGLTPYIFIHDDGYSGTRWDRPAWQELISLVDADKVGCIIIKDSSRMGRDYLRVGLYRDDNVKHKLKKHEFIFQKPYINLSHIVKTGNRDLSQLPVFILLLCKILKLPMNFQMVIREHKNFIKGQYFYSLFAFFNISLKFFLP